MQNRLRPMWWGVSPLLFILCFPHEEGRGGSFGHSGNDAWHVVRLV